MSRLRRDPAARSRRPESQDIRLYQFVLALNISGYTTLGVLLSGVSTNRSCLHVTRDRATKQSRLPSSKAVLHNLVDLSYEWTLIMKKLLKMRTMIKITFMFQCNPTRQATIPIQIYLIAVIQCRFLLLGNGRLLRSTMRNKLIIYQKLIKTVTKSKNSIKNQIKLLILFINSYAQQVIYDLKLEN
ncbi:hypothetical protein AGLY_013230 [Aphis glycines]|uniref:Uncharacterized protein n=1 Tax=Aphis glycines TaxID=307491 RepID=A0A6G0T710_APHGL|nr:hypothetical protein AGLY_013230 [Aphis glycines]